MALTNNNLEIIKALANNDIHSAKKAALASLAEDTSKKNESIISYYRKLLTSNSSIMMTNLPANMQTFLVGEAPGDFNPNQYYVRELEAKIVEEVYKMKLVADEMSRRNIRYANTTLLYGESGTGKTELGKYIAYKLRLPFFYVKFSSIIDSYLGSTAKNINKIFDFCKSIPCVLMLDEVDCITMKRTTEGSKGVDGEIERTTISIMQELDNLPNHIVLLAATNRLDIMDEAFSRRFSNKHEIPEMSTKELIQLGKQFLEATKTIEFVDENILNELASHSKNPGKFLPELKKEIGNNMFESMKDNFVSDIENQEPINVFEVTSTWKTTIPADTEEEAISIAKRNRYNSNIPETYSAKRAEFLS